MSTPLTPDERVALIQRVFTKAYQETESWAVDNIGSELACLAWAIAECGPAGFVAWGDDATSTVRILALFREWFPPEDPIWKFIRVPEPAEAAEAASDLPYTGQ